MFVWRSYIKTTTQSDIYGNTKQNHKIYKMLLLFGIIPLFVSIDGK